MTIIESNIEKIRAVCLLQTLVSGPPLPLPIRLTDDLLCFPSTPSKDLNKPQFLLQDF